MKAKFLIPIALMIFISTTTIAQSGFTNKDEAKNEYKDSLKEGKWMEYVDASFKPTKKEAAIYYNLTTYTNGKENGIVRRYSVEDDKLRVETPYVNGKKNGVAKWYFPSGTLGAETPFNNDKIDGVQKQYYESGKIKWEIPFFNGKTHGTAKEYFESGTVKAEVPYSDSLRNGLSKEYFEDGQVKWETPYVNGKKNGTDRIYYKFSSDTPNKRNPDDIEWETPYTNDKINGSQVHYSIHGEKTIINFINGKQL